MRLIDADTIFNNELLLVSAECYDAVHAVIERINNAPTVDPVKHGKWINDRGIYKCTACNDLCLVAGWAHCIPEKQMYKVFKFCPNCGAKMEEAVE